MINNIHLCIYIGSSQLMLKNDVHSESHEEGACGGSTGKQ